MAGSRPGMESSVNLRRADILDLRNVELLDRIGVDRDRLVDQAGDDLREEDQDSDEYKLQADPGYGADINVARFDFGRRHAAQIEQGKTEGRMHEGGLRIGADQDAEPDEIDAEF